MEVDRYKNSSKLSNSSPSRPKMGSQIGILKNGPLNFLVGEKDREPSPLAGFMGFKQNENAESPSKRGFTPLSFKEKQGSAGSFNENRENSSPSSTRDARNFMQIITKADKDGDAYGGERIPVLTALKTEDLTEEDRIRYLQLLESSYAAEDL